MSARPKSAAMLDARRRDSETKRARVLAALSEMLRDETPITFASVARRAEVSSWLVYASGIREAIEDGRARQSAQQPSERQTARSAVGLATDLALARAEITRLRAERDEQHRHVQLALGATLDERSKVDLVARIDELTHRNGELVAESETLRAENRALAAQVVVLEDDLAAARTSLRRMIRSENLTPTRD